MNALAHLRRAAQGLVLCCLVALLAACTLSSGQNLISDDEAVTPLPASFAFFPYDDKPDGLVRAEGAAEVFTLDGKAYVSADKSMWAHFVPLAGDGYLLVATAAEGSLYGVARLFETGVVEVRMLFDAGLEPALAAAAAPAAVTSAVKVVDGGIEVTSREALDFLIALIDSGGLPTTPLIGYVAETPASPTPALITRDGDGWKVTN